MWFTIFTTTEWVHPQHRREKKNVELPLNHVKILFFFVGIVCITCLYYFIFQPIPWDPFWYRRQLGVLQAYRRYFPLCSHLVCGCRCISRFSFHFAALFFGELLICGRWKLLCCYALCVCGVRSQLFIEVSHSVVLKRFLAHYCHFHSCS